MPPETLYIPKLTLASAGDSRESVLYKGSNGSGKTYAALTWPGPIRGIYTEKNRKTVDQALRRGVDVELELPGSQWEWMLNQWAPAVKNREIKAETIVVDSADQVATAFQYGIAPIGTEMNHKKWGLFANRLQVFFGDITSATMPRGKPGDPSYHPGYNIVVTCHDRWWTDANTGERVEHTVKIDGGFKRELEDYFDTVLLCRAKKRAKEVTEAGRKRIIQEPYWTCLTVPPDNFQTCKGPGLPAEVGGTYTELQAAWDAAGSNTND